MGQDFQSRPHHGGSRLFQAKGALSRDRSYLGCPEAYIYKHELRQPRRPDRSADRKVPLRGPACWTGLDLRPRIFVRVRSGQPALGHGRYVGPVNLLQYQYPGETLGVPPISGCGDFSCFGSPPGWFPTGYDPASHAIENDYNPFAGEQTIIPKTERFTITQDGSYQITDGIELYGEFLKNRRTTYQNGWRQIWAFGGTSDSYGTYWAPGSTRSNWLTSTAITNHANSSQRVDYWRGVGGLRGDLGGFLKGWSYDAYVQYSHNKEIYKTEQFLQDIYDVSSFQTASCVGTTPSRSGKQCMDVPWTDPNFLLGNVSPTLADYLFDWETGRTIYNQLSGEASLTGNLFNLPAGPVGAAFGVTARRDSINNSPGEITQSGNAWGASTQASRRVTQ